MIHQENENDIEIVGIDPDGSVFRMTFIEDLTFGGTRCHCVASDYIYTPERADWNYLDKINPEEYIPFNKFMREEVSLDVMDEIRDEIIGTAETERLWVRNDQ